MKGFTINDSNTILTLDSSKIEEMYDSGPISYIKELYNDYKDKKLNLQVYCIKKHGSLGILDAWDCSYEIFLNNFMKLVKTACE